MQSVNPATGAVLRDYPEHSSEEIAAILSRAETAFASWRSVPFAQRAALMRRAGANLRQRCDEHAALMTAEMGKTFTAAKAEAEKCALCCDFYAEHAEAFLAPEVVATDASRSLVRYDPLGPVLAVMPWNFPYWQVIRFAAPALMAGNVGLLKHASNVPGCALAIEAIFQDAGFPRGCFQALMIGSRAVEGVIADPAVRAVTLTGSEPAGMAVAAAAGRALKKTVLELGGSDPFIILEDADVQAAARTAAQARCINNGQSCIAAKRFIVVEAAAEAFEEAFLAAMSALRVGDPMDPATDVGPMARLDLLEELHAQVERSVATGAVLRLGGKRLEGRRRLLPAHGPDGGEAGNGRLRRGDLWARGGGDPGRGRGGRRGPGQPVLLRARGEPLDEGPPARRGPGRPDRVGLRLHQRDGQERPAPALRRRETLGLRAGVERLRHPRVREH